MPLPLGTLATRLIFTGPALAKTYSSTARGRPAAAKAQALPPPGPQVLTQVVPGTVPCAKAAASFPVV